MSTERPHAMWLQGPGCIPGAHAELDGASKPCPFFNKGNDSQIDTSYSVIIFLKLLK